MFGIFNTTQYIKILSFFPFTSSLKMSCHWNKDISEMSYYNTGKGVLHKVSHRIPTGMCCSLFCWLYYQSRWLKKSELPNNLHESFPYQMLILCKQQPLYSSKLWSSGIYSLLVLADCTRVTCDIYLANSVKKRH